MIPLNPFRLIGAVIKPVSDYFIKREERKATKDSLKAKAIIARDENEQTLNLNDKEWEQLKAEKEPSTWKDEYSLVLGSSPFLLVIVGSIAHGFGYPELLTGALKGIGHLVDMKIDVALICTGSIFTGLGLKVWK